MVYYIDKFSSKERYAQFIRYMLSISDAFSVVYFRYSESEPLKKSTREIKKLLDPYKSTQEIQPNGREQRHGIREGMSIAWRFTKQTPERRKHC